MNWCLDCAAMEESMRRDFNWAFASCRKLEVCPCWSHFSGFPSVSIFIHFVHEVFVFAASSLYRSSLPCELTILVRDYNRIIGKDMIMVMVFTMVLWTTISCSSYGSKLVFKFESQRSGLWGSLQSIINDSEPGMDWLVSI